MFDPLLSDQCIERRVTVVVLRHTPITNRLQCFSNRHDDVGGLSLAFSHPAGRIILVHARCGGRCRLSDIWEMIG